METIDPATLRLAAVVESSDDAIISQSLAGTIETWNRAAQRMFGYAASEAIGRSIDLIVPPDRRADEQHLIDQVFAGASPGQFESLGLAKNGTLVPIAVSLSPVLAPDGQLLGVSRLIRDITRHKALERDAFRLAAIVDSAEDAIVSKDLNGVVLTWNRAAERMFGYTSAEIVGQSITRIIPTERLGEEEEVLSRIRAGKSMDHFETVRRRKDGSLIDISLTVSPIKTSDGVVIGASKIARDITTQRLLARAAEEANRVKDEFLATLSHELRTPLNAVLGYTRMIRLGHFGDDRQERAFDIIERNANILSQLVSDVLDVSSIVTGKVRLKLADADLGVALGSALDIIRPSAEAKGVALQSETPAAPVHARCDTDRMQQVFWNLLSNAVKFTPADGRVAVRLVAGRGIATVTVTDTGIGIGAESLPYVFQRFWQGESGGARNIGGLGLGLALARHFVELHGGTITAASDGEGKGATFQVTLPLSSP